MTVDLVLATSNVGKVRQLQSLLSDDVVVKSLADFGLTAPEESGATFAANASLKAISAAKATGILALADDSGLEVEALGGAPGVLSARYSGEGATDTSNIERLLADLDAVPDCERSARFVCVLTLANNDGVLYTVTGECLGQIARARRGTNGFGYDPVFELEDGRTVAELTIEEKNRISHRGIAMREMMPGLLIAIATQRLHIHGAGQ
jgi:XTP/dITP diphosphohydrolase